MSSRSKVARRLRQMVMLLALIMIVVSAAMIAGSIKNDVSIDRDRVATVATVRHVGPVKTLISFRDESGDYHSPPEGVLYPGGLAEDQKVWVEYSASNPDLVRVQGRTWVLALLLALSTLFITLALAWGAFAALSVWEKRGAVTTRSLSTSKIHSTDDNRAPNGKSQEN